jgi:hypothetical protein
MTISSLDYEKSGIEANTYVFDQSNTIYAVVLEASTEDSITIPTGAAVAFFASTAPFYMLTDGTAAIPAANVEDGSASELNPTSTRVRGHTTLSFISAQACTITITFYAGA